MKKFISCLILVVFVCLNANFVKADCDKKQVRKAASSRYILKKGEALDKKTQLTWCRCSVGTIWKEGVGCVGSPKMMNFEEAKKFAKKSGNGWRMPTVNELTSIVDEKCKKPYLNSIVFPDIKEQGEGAGYWSTTRFEQMPTLIYYVDFINGRVDCHSEGFGMAVRLVRSQK